MMGNEKPVSAPDRALWITWYDLPQEGRGEYLDWLHGDFIAGLLARPGYLAAAHYAAVEKSARQTNARDMRKVIDDPAVPRGDRYILIVGAGHANVFGDPTPSALHAQASGRDKAMLAMRIGERTVIMSETARTDGPQACDHPGPALAPCIQVGAYNCPWQNEEEMLAFYAQWRMPAMGRTPGCVRIRKLVSVYGWAKHGVLYEFTSLEERNKHFMAHEDGHPDIKAWGDKVTRTLTHAPGSSSLACRLWPRIEQ